ncbi:hypothetical protein [Achromobacter spanius]|uniref:hypothetical protein n=1 Tax=Achromobacter spanius TaxID=217203 RepID=UPI003A922B53
MKIARYLLIIMLSSFSFISAKSVFANQCVEFSQVPIKITKPGCYLLGADISVSDPHADAITIDANDVEINFNGHQIKNLSGPATHASGIYANSVRNVIIKNGEVFGFFYAVRVDGGSDGKKSENITVSNMVATSSYFRGFSIEATNAKIERNRLESTGGTIVFPDAFAIAIEVKGDFCVVKNNSVNNVDATGIGEGIGISLSSSRNNCNVNENDVKSSLIENSTFGIWLSGGGWATTVEKNKIEGFTYPFSIPRSYEGKYPFSITTTFTKNQMRKIHCNPSNFGSYFLRLPKSNKFIENQKSCPVLISEILKRKYELKKNATANFRLATAMYQCADEPRLSKEACCEMQARSISYFERAGDLGLAEAKRVLPGVTNAVKNNPQCH